VIATARPHCHLAATAAVVLTLFCTTQRVASFTVAAEHEGELAVVVLVVTTMVVLMEWDSTVMILMAAVVYKDVEVTVMRDSELLLLSYGMATGLLKRRSAA
jgi:hypothetical protein